MILTPKQQKEAQRAQREKETRAKEAALLADIRWKNASKLMAQFDTKKQFADACGLAKAQIAHILGEAPLSAIGNTIARRIEKGCNKPSYWLDIDHTATLGATKSANLELMIDVTTSLRRVLKKNGISIDSLTERALEALLRHLFELAVQLGKVPEAQIKDALSATGILK